VRLLGPHRSGWLAAAGALNPDLAEAALGHRRGGYSWQLTNPWGLRDGDRLAIPHEVIMKRYQGLDGRSFRSIISDYV
jgi:hypothetical protein